MPSWLTIEFGLTCLVLMVVISFVAFAAKKSGEPYNIERPNRLPWKLIVILSGFLAAMILVHIINLFGYETGVDKGLLGRR